MESAGWMGKLHAACEWITRLAYVNMLWLFFTLIGLIVTGLFPATVAMFTVIRKWIRGDEAVSVFSTFWSVYKKEFFKANLLGGILGSLASVILIGGFIMDSLSAVFSGVAIGLLFLAAVVLLYLFPVYVHFDFTVRETAKTSFILSASFPLQTIMMLSTAILAVIITLAFPAVGFLFFGSTLSFVLMKIANGIFENISRKEGAGSPVIKTVQ